MYSAFLMHTSGKDGKVSFSELVRGVTKREAHGKLLSAMGGAGSGPIVKDGHAYYGNAPKK